MVRQETSLSFELTADQVSSMATPFPEFIARQSIPSQLGYAAHSRLEDIFGLPIASDSSQPNISDPAAQQRSGESLGNKVGVEKEFTRNLPVIRGTMKDVAENRGITEDDLWDEVLTILDGSGIGHAMQRTLDRPLGGSYGARDYLADNSSSGMALIVRENIANWGARRHDKMLGLLGGLPLKALSNVRQVIYAGTGRVYNGAELWRPELTPYISTDADGKKTSTITEYSAGVLLHKPKTDELFEKLGLGTQIAVDVIGVDDPKASGDDVMKAVADAHGQSLKDMLIVEVGNAPAGYTQLAGGLVLARELGIDPTQQFVAISDSVELVHPRHFEALDLQARSKVQNAATALNSINGWLKAISDVDKYMLGTKQ